MTHITLSPSQNHFSAHDDETILDAALRHGHPLPYGCRNGACGSCKGKITQGKVHHKPHQDKALSQADKAQGYALLCCAIATEDVTVECKELTAAKDLQIKTLPCRVEQMEKLADDVMLISLKLPTNERLQFLAGQYIDLLTRDGKRRSYSLANAPHDDGFLQLHIRYQPTGEFSRHVFDTMKVRDMMRFQGPLGGFFLREDSNKPIIFIASGTGFAPVKSILEHMFHNGIKRDVVFYWGARSKKDLYLHQLAQDWQDAYPHFRYIPVLSEALPEDNWQGRTGLVHQAVVDDFANVANYEVYACGAPVMVEAAHTALTQTRALPEDAFYSDAFFSAKDLAKK